MRILVTGAGGYLGSACVGHLAGRHEVTAGGHSSPERPDAVIHMAFRFPKDNSARAELENQTALRAMIDFCMARNVSRFIFPSTYAVYPCSERTAVESDALFPESEYARGKGTAERMLQESGLPHVILRLTHVYGRGTGVGDEGGVILQWLDRAMHGKDIEVIDGETIERDYIHLRDVLAAVEACLEREPAMGRVYNIGSGAGVTLLDLARQIARIAGGETGRDVSVRNRRSATPVIWRRRVDLRRAEEELGFYPRVNLVEGLKEMAAARTTGLPDQRLRRPKCRRLRRRPEAAAR
ncbi:MAG: hypothetical protein A3G34_14265 [Candidatus Lindowbacteria bacterium RIFCSPLOWO2_12_FULL_62_27]|nr:MAG: hypothetical protein A3I06_15750 [Candidatus Lindowbacteria bacterium RIFCSPLOWO2_02_FULL_62_12]OGH62729.1 MAG: hypothetical protein A3G34_14265 [Candidatus Lindowbacteria bacterium RIFCSPLOWO2_12_FULL_62_27]